MNQVCLRSIAVGVLLSAFMGSASAQTATRSEEWNLEGTWKLSVGLFEVQPSGGCIVKIPTGNAGEFNGPIAISKSASGYSIRINTPASKAPAEIRVSGNQAIFVEKVQYGPLEVVGKWVGTISQEVDQSRRKVVTRISGTETCNNQATLPFTFLKEDELTETTSHKPSPSCQGGVVLSQPSRIYYDALVPGTQVEISNLNLRVCPERVVHSYGDNPDEKIPAQFEIAYKTVLIVPSHQAADSLNQAYSTVNNVMSGLAGFLLSKVTGPVKSALGGVGISEALGRSTHSWKRGDTLTRTYSAIYDPALRITTITETEKLEGTREEAGKEVHKIFREGKTTYRDSNKPPFSYD